MIHQRQSLAFRLEASNEFLGIHAAFDDFQRHSLLDRLQSFGKINRPHASFAEFLQQLVRPNLLTDRFAWFGAHRRFGVILCQQTIGLFMSCEQHLNTVSLEII